MFRQVMLLLLFVAGISRAESDELSWPQFRGPNGSGVSDSADIPDEWSADKKSCLVRQHSWVRVFFANRRRKPKYFSQARFLTGKKARLPEVCALNRQSMPLWTPRTIGGYIVFL